jgi:hypothetical protein
VSGSGPLPSARSPKGVEFSAPLRDHLRYVQSVRARARACVVMHVSGASVLVRVRISVHSCVWVCLCVCVRACSCVRARACVYVRVRVCAQACVRVGVCVRNVGVPVRHVTPSRTVKVRLGVRQVHSARLALWGVRTVADSRYGPPDGRTVNGNIVVNRRVWWL